MGATSPTTPPPQRRCAHAGDDDRIWSRATGHVIFSDDCVGSARRRGISHGRIDSGTGSFRAAEPVNSVTVSVVDQYGDAMRNVAVLASHSDLDRHGVADADGNVDDADVDQVVYPEEVDRTVQTREDYNGNGTLGETDEVDPMGPFVGRIDPAKHPGRTRTCRD